MSPEPAVDGRRMRRVAFFLAVLLGLLVPGSAAGDEGLILRRATARPGEIMTVWGSCGRKPIYLVSESYARRSLLIYFSRLAPRPPSGPPFRFLGRTVCTRQDHYVGDFPDGDWSSWSGYLGFHVPPVRPGRYQLVVYCAPCRHGPGGSLVMNNWLWRGSRRVGPTGLTILADRT
jgi:hypothetical protein